MTTTDAQTETRTCPPSAVHDMILPWSDVREGDLVLAGGQLYLVREITNALAPGWLEIGLEGSLMELRKEHDHLTAVRRYDTGEG
jgi:hypothetical protein